MDEESVNLLCVCWVTAEGEIRHCAMHAAAARMYVAAFKALPLLKFFAHFIADHRSSEELFNDARCVAAIHRILILRLGRTSRQSSGDRPCSFF